MNTLSRCSIGSPANSISISELTPDDANDDNEGDRAGKAASEALPGMVTMKLQTGGVPALCKWAINWLGWLLAHHTQRSGSVFNNIH